MAEVWRCCRLLPLTSSGQEPGLQLRPGVHRLGSGLLHGKTRRNHQGHNRKPQLGLLSVRHCPHYRGYPGPSYKTAFRGRGSSTLCCHEITGAGPGWETFSGRRRQKSPALEKGGILHNSDRPPDPEGGGSFQYPTRLCQGIPPE